MGLDLTKIAVQCRLRAAEYRRKAERAFLKSDRRYYGVMAQQWFAIAQGYEDHQLKREIIVAKSRKALKQS